MAVRAAFSITSGTERITIDTPVTYPCMLNTMLCHLCLAPRVHRTFKSGVPKLTLWVGCSRANSFGLWWHPNEYWPWIRCTRSLFSLWLSGREWQRWCASIGAPDLVSLSQYYHWSTTEDWWICQKSEKDCFSFHSVSHLRNLIPWIHQHILRCFPLMLEAPCQTLTNLEVCVPWNTLM